MTSLSGVSSTTNVSLMVAGSMVDGGSALMASIAKTFV
jgi:hypothetical protein